MSKTQYYRRGNNKKGFFEELVNENFSGGWENFVIANNKKVIKSDKHDKDDKKKVDQLGIHMDKYMNDQIGRQNQMRNADLDTLIAHIEGREVKDKEEDNMQNNTQLIQVDHDKGDGIMQKVWNSATVYSKKLVENTKIAIIDSKDHLQKMSNSISQNIIPRMKSMVDGVKNKLSQVKDDLYRYFDNRKHKKLQEKFYDIGYAVMVNDSNFKNLKNIMEKYEKVVNLFKIMRKGNFINDFQRLFKEKRLLSELKNLNNLFGANDLQVLYPNVANLKKNIFSNFINNFELADLSFQVKMIDSMQDMAGVCNDLQTELEYNFQQDGQEIYGLREDVKTYMLQALDHKCSNLLEGNMVEQGIVGEEMHDITRFYSKFPILLNKVRGELLCNKYMNYAYKEINKQQTEFERVKVFSELLLENRQMNHILNDHRFHDIKQNFFKIVNSDFQAMIDKFLTQNKNLIDENMHNFQERSFDKVNSNVLELVKIVNFTNNKGVLKNIRCQKWFKEKVDDTHLLLKNYLHKYEQFYIENSVKSKNMEKQVAQNIRNIKREKGRGKSKDKDSKLQGKVEKNQTEKNQITGAARIANKQSGIRDQSIAKKWHRVGKKDIISLQMSKMTGFLKNIKRNIDNFVEPIRFNYKCMRLTNALNQMKQVIVVRQVIGKLKGMGR